HGSGLYRFSKTVCAPRSRCVLRYPRQTKYHRLYSHPVDKSTGVIAEQTIALDGFYAKKEYPRHLRRIRFCDPESGKRLVFLTNNFVLSAATIAALYKKLWQVLAVLRIRKNLA